MVLMFILWWLDRVKSVANFVFVLERQLKRFDHLLGQEKEKGTSMILCFSIPFSSMYTWNIWAYTIDGGAGSLLNIFWTWITLKRTKKMNLKCFFHLIHLFQRNPGSKMRIKYASPICWMPGLYASDRKRRNAGQVSHSWKKSWWSLQSIKNVW